MTRSIAGTLARFMLRTADTPLSAVWAFAYWSVMRSAVLVLKRKYRDASIHLKGSFASQEEVYGISDIDLVVVLTGDPAQPGAVQLRAREDWKQFCRRFPLFSLVVQHCWFYEEDDLRESLSAPCLTYGLPSSPRNADDRTGFLGPRALRDHLGLLTRPALYGAHREWRSLSDLNRLPPEVADDPQSRSLAAWLDLQYWWRHAFQACADPTAVRVPLLCVKLIAEPIRLLLWAERGEQVPTREAALRRGMSELPDEREVLQFALGLMKELPRSPAAPLPQAIAALLRNTERVARHMSAAAEAAGYTDVRLTGSEEAFATRDMRDRVHALTKEGFPCELLPLADWRALAVPSGPDEAMMLIQASLVDPSFLAAIANADGGDAIPAFHYNSMVFTPTTNPERGILRAVQCQPTDPVSIALAEGKTVARFPELAGWSASHSAMRAVAEHRAWLEADRRVIPPHGWIGVQSAPHHSTLRTMGLLFTAARAALFLESIIDGDPELAVTIAGVADGLIARDPDCRDAVEPALHDIRAARSAESTNVRSVAPMLEVVRKLPAYTGSLAFAMGVR